jgi:hypothetical protein
LSLTFVDAGVLIAASRGNDSTAERAIEILDDPHRIFAATAFLRLEILPKARFHNRVRETAFYESFFAAVELWVEPNSALTPSTPSRVLTAR